MCDKITFVMWCAKRCIIQCRRIEVKRFIMNDENECSMHIALVIIITVTRLSHNAVVVSWWPRASYIIQRRSDNKSWCPRARKMRQTERSWLTPIAAEIINNHVSVHVHEAISKMVAIGALPSVSQANVTRLVTTLTTTLFTVDDKVLWAAKHPEFAFETIAVEQMHKLIWMHNSGAFCSLNSTSEAKINISCWNILDGDDCYCSPRNEMILILQVKSRDMEIHKLPKFRSRGFRKYFCLRWGESSLKAKEKPKSSLGDLWCRSWKRIHANDCSWNQLYFHRRFTYT